MSLATEDFRVDDPVAPPTLVVPPGAAAPAVRAVRYLAVKHAVERAAATVSGVVLLPLILAVAAGVRLTLGPGVIFRQARVGRFGQVFTWGY